MLNFSLGFRTGFPVPAIFFSLNTQSLSLLKFTFSVWAEIWQQLHWIFQPFSPRWNAAWLETLIMLTHFTLPFLLQLIYQGAVECHMYQNEKSILLYTIYWDTMCVVINWCPSSIRGQMDEWHHMWSESYMWSKSVLPANACKDFQNFRPKQNEKYRALVEVFNKN